MNPETVGTLFASTLDDVLLAGFAEDEGDWTQFYSQQRMMFLVVGGQLLELRCIQDTGTIRMRPASEFSTPQYLEDDQRPSVMSVNELVLVDPDADNRIVNLRLWKALFRSESVVCSAAEIELDHGQILFFDPSYHYGIRIGGVEQRQKWIRDWHGAAGFEVWNLREDLATT